MGETNGASAKGGYAVIAAGGTGGHMFPAQALAEALLARGWRVALSSDARGLRYAGGFPDAVARREVSAGTTARAGLASKLSAPFQLLSGVRAARAWFRADPPDVVAGFGGYPSAPAVAAARLLGLPCLIHEQNGVLGRANALFASHVDLLALGVAPLENPPRRLKAGGEMRHLGNPVRRSALDAMGAPYAPPAPDERIRLLVFGGSQGARIFAEMAPAALSELPVALRGRLSVTQQARAGEIAGVRAGYADAGIEAEVDQFFTDLPSLMRDAHLIISRAGASTMAELGVIGRPAILAPFPAALGDHQTANARPAVAAGAAVLAPDAKMSAESLSALIKGLLDDPARLAHMASMAAGLGKPDATRDLADAVEALKRGRRLSSA